MTVVPLAKGELVPLGVAPPTILAQSRLMSRMHPQHAAMAALTTQKQLDRQIAHAQMRVQYRRPLPITQQDFYRQRGKK